MRPLIFCVFVGVRDRIYLADIVYLNKIIM